MFDRINGSGASGKVRDETNHSLTLTKVLTCLLACLSDSAYATSLRVDDGPKNGLLVEYGLVNLCHSGFSSFYSRDGWLVLLMRRLAVEPLYTGEKT